MKMTLLLITSLATAFPAHAFTSMPFKVLCKMSIHDNVPFYENGWSAFELSSDKVNDPVRVRQMKAIAIAYVAPAMKAACTGPLPDSGNRLHEDAEAACEKGCAELNPPGSPGKYDWSTRLVICHADCARGAHFLNGVLWGTGIKR